MAALSGPVGRGGRNSRSDVLEVQRLLNACRRLLIPGAPLAEDGIAGPATVALITEFQRRVLNRPSPDGRVDPGGKTLAKLNEMAGAARARPANVQAFVAMTLVPARAARAKWRVPVSVLIAQAALESGWGQSVKGNAYFGIKRTASTQRGVEFGTTEYVRGEKVSVRDSFRAYASFAEAAEDYGRFLNTNPRYRQALMHTSDPLRFADEIAKAGYATDPQYAAKVKRIIEAYGLREFD